MVILDCNKSEKSCDFFKRSKNKLIMFTGRSKYQFEVYHGEINLNDIEKFVKDVRYVCFFTVDEAHCIFIINLG